MFRTTSSSFTTLLAISRSRAVLHKSTQIKGTGSQDRIQILREKWILLGLNSDLSQVQGFKLKMSIC